MAMEYGSSGAQSNDDMFADGMGDSDRPKMESENEETGLLPKSIMAGKEFKPGDEIVLQITAVHDKDFEVKYAAEEGEKGGEKEMAEAPQGGGSQGGPLAGMME